MSPPVHRTPLNIATLINIINSLQMALSKLLKELLDLQKEGDVSLFKNDEGTSTAVDESCGDPFESEGVDESCGSFSEWSVDESCGEVGFENAMRAGVDESCGSPTVDESCGENILPPPCDPESIDLLCRNVIRIALYLRKICWIVRRHRGEWTS